MTTAERDQFERAARLFLEVKDLALERRDDALERACSGNPGLRAAVEELLSGAASPSPFRRLAADLHGSAARIDGESESMIGPYKLLEKIGEGGFGSVYMAEQQQPVRRLVALKILKPGMDTAQVIARFEAERQALALMDHPNITRVLDAGATPQGRPFFVMDLVRGVPITEYCTTHKLAPRARVRLFLSVCDAIQHAHQKGIIHRDLKPSNVLVTLHDGKPVPKVIDFGIAKALHGRLTDRTLFTEFRQFIGTPAYMSPEQAEMSGLDVDTRSDLYSLGVLLYELLTGSTPLDKARLASMPHGEMQRVIREEEPQTPSRRVSTSGRPRTTQLPDPRAATEAARLSRQLRGDLDWIVLRCLEKDRTRRYPSADALAMDLVRYLDDEPVEASPPSTLYRLAKFARRHRGVAAAVIGITSTLFLGASVASYGLFQASAERDKAMAEMKRANAAEASAMSEARRAKTVVDLIASMFAQADPSRSGVVDVPVRRLLDDFAQLHASALEDQPEVLATLQQVMATAYRGIGDVEKAHRFASAAVDALRRLAPHGSCELAGALGALAELEARLGRRDDALRTVEEGDRMSAAACDEGAPERVRFLAAYADVLDAAGKPAEALDRITRAVDGARRSGANGIALGDVLLGRANVLLALDRIAEADADAVAARAAYRTVFNEGHPRVLSCDELSATIKAEAGELEPARALIEDVLAARIAMLGAAHPEVARTRCNLGFVLQTLRRFDAALEQHEAALGVLEATWGEGHPNAIRVRGSIGADLAALGRVDEAFAALRAAHELATKHLGADALETVQVETNLAIAHMRRGENAEAEHLFEHAIDVRRRVKGERSIGLAVLLANLAVVRMNTGRNELAEAGLVDAIAMVEDVAGADHIMAGRFRLNAADVALRRGDHAQAEERARAALAIFERYGDSAAAERAAATELLEQAVAHG